MCGGSLTPLTHPTHQTVLTVKKILRTRTRTLHRPPPPPLHHRRRRLRRHLSRPHPWSPLLPRW